MAKCAFGKVLLRGTFEPSWEFGTELYARLLYLESEKTQVLLAALDTLCTAPADAARFCDLVSQKTGIPSDCIWFHELQVHAAPDCHVMAGVIPVLAAQVAKEAKAMMARAVPYTCQVSEADVGTQYSMNREQYVEGLGGVTIWAGMRFDENGKPYCNDPGRMLLRGYEPKLPVFDKPIYFDNTVDSKAYLFVFRDEQDRVIGTISRFAAHPDVAVLFESYGVKEYHYHFDWPGHLSQTLENHFDAPSMYLNGPCGDLATKKGWDHMDTYEASAAEARRIGTELADMLIAHFNKKHVSLGDPEHLRAAMFTIELPMHERFPHSLAEFPEQNDRAAQAHKILQDAIARNAPAYEVKQYIDDCHRAWQNIMNAKDELCCTEEELSRHTMMTKVFVMQLGNYLFFGVPGESLVDTTMWLRSSFTGVKTIPVDQVGGYYCYMATPRTLTLGGYTNWSSWVSRDAIPLLKEEITKHMENWLDEN